jgi:pyoverdine/dityrosine biosynthesis protein Dit1
MQLNNIEKIILPSSYDISRVQMTGTRYRVMKRDSQATSTNKISVKFFDFLKFKKQAEDKIVYFKEKDFVNYNSIAEKILRVVTSQKYRAGNANLINLEKHKVELLSKFQSHIDKKEAVKFMLPAFPFKIKNPLKSFRMDADLAEVASFCKFNEINLQIKKIYNPGAEFHIFHDGHLYYRHFLHTKEDADNYFNSLKRFTHELQLENAIVLRDAFEELQKFDDFQSIYKKARIEMQNLWDTEKDTNRRILMIRKSSGDNINLSDIDENILYQIATKSDNELDEETKKVKKKISKRADLCAFEYMVVQHTLEKLKFFERSVLNGVRMTVHPKEGQIGVFLVKKTTFLLPWMGVGVMKKSGEVSVRYEHDVKNNPHFAPVFIGTDKFPFYYEEK